MKRLTPILLALTLALSGCGVALIDAREIRPDGTEVRIKAAATHTLSDPVIEEASYGDLHLKGFKGVTVVDGVKALFEGVVRGVVGVFGK